MQSTEPRARLLSWLSAALDRVHGRDCVRRALACDPVNGPVAVIAVGKAAPAMARGALLELGGDIKEALVITKHGHTDTLPWPLLTAAHPVPDESSLAAGAALLEFIEALPMTRPILFLLSGGASSLVEVLPDGIGLDQLRHLNQWVLANGIDIITANDMRKRISLIKGGGLARLLYPRSVNCLIISDVPGDDPASIGSGPLWDTQPRTLPGSLPDELRAVVAEVDRKPSPCPGDHIRTSVIASIADAVDAAVAMARKDGFQVHADAGMLRGDVMQLAPVLARQLNRARPGEVLVWGGESTVDLPPNPGRGGRNQSLALAMAIELEGTAGEYFLAAGTDGTDGPGDDAGALVDGGTVTRGEQQQLDAAAYLRAADAGRYLEVTGDLITTGPTGTNVMDIAIGMKCE